MNLLYQRTTPAPPARADIIEALTVARGYIKNGWVQHIGYADIDGQDCYCLVAAITAASRTEQIRERALRACELAMPRGYASLAAYNDARDRVVGDVLWLLDAAKAFAGEAVAP